MSDRPKKKLPKPPPPRAHQDRPAGVGPRLLADVRAWCDGRWWQVRLPLLVGFLWIWARHTHDPMYQSVFKGLNLGIHELGHFVFIPFGEIATALGGSILQCLVPVIGMAMFVRQRDYFAIAFAFGWLATNYFELAVYVGDAVKMQLPLVTPGGGEPIHDWNYVLGNYGWLRSTEAIAGLHTAAGHVCMLICLGGGGWIVAKMFASATRRHSGAVRRRVNRTEPLLGGDPERDSGFDSHDPRGAPGRPASPPPPTGHASTPPDRVPRG